MKNTDKKLPKFFVLRSKDLEEYFGSRVAIMRSAERGEIQSLSSGLYASPSLDPMTASVIATAKYYPKAVISGRTALFLHKLSDHAVEKIEVDILEMPGALLGDCREAGLNATRYQWHLRWDADMVCKTSGEESMIQLREKVLKSEID